MNTQPRSQIAQHFLDITNEVCPMTFVKIKLIIEKMPRNDVLEVRLKGKEPLTNVPRSILEFGHMVLYLEPEHGDQNPLGIHRLLIRKI
jgi:TusA-related sulfurtransferase